MVAFLAAYTIEGVSRETRCRGSEGRILFYRHNKYGKKQLSATSRAWLWLAWTLLWPKVQKQKAIGLIPL